MLKFQKTEIQAKELSLSATAPHDSKSANKNQVDDVYTAAVLIAQNSFKRKCCEFCNLKNHVSSKCRKIIESTPTKKIL